MATDTSGQQAVDFVWGNFPMQPNDDRAGAVSPANFSANTSGDNYWGATTMVASERLNAALSNHAVAEAKYAGYPGFTGNDDGAYISGVAYIVVPSVIGDTTAVALDKLKDAGYETASITTASAAVNAVSTISAVARTGTTATITSTGAGAKYPVGTKITVASLAAPDTALNGTFTVTAVATDTVSYTTATSGTLSTGSLSVAGLSGVAGTIKTQSTAANAASVATTATITVTPYATVS